MAFPPLPREDIGPTRAAGRPRDEVETLRERVAALEARNAALERYAHAAAHDLAQPVRGIAQLCARIREEHGKDLPAEAARLLDLAQRSAGRLQGMLHEQLDEARGRATAGGPGRSPAVTGDEVLAEVLELVAPSAEVAGCRARVAGPLPSVAVGRAELFRLLANLVGNAIRHHRGEAAPEVEVGATAEPGGRGWWRFWVADNGPGVPASERERVFGAGAGAGLGLALCREIVARHGGRVWVEPASATRGARFLFTLPAADPAGSGRGGGAARRPR